MDAREESEAREEGRGRVLWPWLGVVLMWVDEEARSRVGVGGGRPKDSLLLGRVKWEDWWGWSPDESAVPEVVWLALVRLRELRTVMVDGM